MTQLETPEYFVKYNCYDNTDTGSVFEGACMNCHVFPVSWEGLRLGDGFIFPTVPSAMPICNSTASTVMG